MTQMKNAKKTKNVSETFLQNIIFSEKTFLNFGNLFETLIRKNTMK